jgi:hypothetical protein
MSRVSAISEKQNTAPERPLRLIGRRAVYLPLGLALPLSIDTRSSQRSIFVLGTDQSRREMMLIACSFSR